MKFSTKALALLVVCGIVVAVSADSEGSYVPASTSLLDRRHLRSPMIGFQSRNRFSGYYNGGSSNSFQLFYPQFPTTQKTPVKNARQSYNQFPTVSQHGSRNVQGAQIYQQPSFQHPRLGQEKYSRHIYNQVPTEFSYFQGNLWKQFSDGNGLSQWQQLNKAQSLSSFPKGDEDVVVVGSNDPILLDEQERSGEDEVEVNGWGEGFDVYPAVPPEHLQNNP